MAEMRKSGHPGEGEADDVELRAREADLLVDAGQLQQAVRIAGHERRARRGQGAVDRPGVAAGPDGRFDAEQVHGPGPQRGGDVGAPELVGKAREQDVVDQEDPQRGPRLPGLRRGGRCGELGGSAPAVLECPVHAVDVGLAPPAGFGVQRCETLPGRVVQPRLAGEGVPLDAGRAELFGRPALGAPAFHLDLPGTVRGGVASLQEGQLVGGIGAKVGDAPGVAESLSGHGWPGCGVSRKRNPQEVR